MAFESVSCYKTWFWVIFFSFRTGSHLLLAQHTISGYVYDAASGEALAGAAVYDKQSKRGVVANRYGFYSLTVNQDSIYLQASFLGYKPVIHHFQPIQDTLLNLYLSSTTQELTEVVIQSSSDFQSEAAGSSITKIPIQQLEAVPALVGEPDIMRALALTPGVSNGVEGTTGLLVRGGSPDQNLILLDEATVYNASHLFGLVSIFNTDAISDVALIKGGFPARYGGRLSSVVDILMKEGNNQHFRGKASLGLISSHATVEGPIVKDKTSFIVSARSSYLNLLLLPIKHSYHQGNLDSYFTYHLYDLNAKVNHRFSDNSRLFLSLYRGQDQWQVEEGTPEVETSQLKLKWGNTTATLRYSKPLAPKLFGRVMLNYSQYQYAVNTASETYESENTSEPALSYFNTQSGVCDWGTRLLFDYYPAPTHTIKFGGEFTAHRYTPNQLDTSEPINGLSSVVDPVTAQEAAMFVEDTWEVNRRLNVNIGVRFSSFNVEDKAYQAVEPRLSLRYRIYSDWFVQGSYSYMQQYIHLLTNNGAGLPNDIWVPATALVPPQQASQWAVGISKKFSDLNIDFSLEAYLKNMNALIDYQPGANLLYNFKESWEDAIATSGEGVARGIEFFAHKQYGKWNGWLSYTLSKNERRFNEINQGQWYPANYDRRHDVSLTGSYQLSDKWKLSSSWLFSSGQPVTLPVAIQENLAGEQVLVYQGRNNARMLAYHRLDVGLSRTATMKRGREATLSFGVYNFYNRKNPFYLEIGTGFALADPNDLGSDFVPSTRTLRQQSLLPFLPSVSYSLTF